MAELIGVRPPEASRREPLRTPYFKGTLERLRKKLSRERAERLVPVLDEIDREQIEHFSARKVKAHQSENGESVHIPLTYFDIGPDLVRRLRGETVQPKPADTPLPPIERTYYIFPAY